jgi:hypothetical protein
VVKHKTLISNLVRLTLLPAEACALPSEGFVLFGEAMTLPPEANALPGEAPGRLRFRLRDILGFVECVLWLSNGLEPPCPFVPGGIGGAVLN